MPEAVATENPTRVLIVDRDREVRRFLQQELTAAGYEVDTLSSGDGFTEDMVALVRPDVLLVDPLMSDVAPPAVEQLLARLRADSHLVLLLIDSGQDAHELLRIGQVCSADGIVKKSDLLASPATAVGDQLLPEAFVEAVEVEPEERTVPGFPSAVVAARSGLDIQLELEPAPPRVVRQSPASIPPPRRSGPSRPDFLAMIQEELQDHPPPTAKTPGEIDVEVNLFSRHNFYVGSSGDLATGGVFVATAVLPAVGLHVRLRLKLPLLPPLSTEAVVEWRRETNANSRAPSGVGLTLAHISAVQRQQLERFFRERAPLTYLPNRQ